MMYLFRVKVKSTNHLPGKYKTLFWKHKNNFGFNF